MRVTLPKSIWTLGFVGLLINMSTIIVFSQMPIFMEKEFGASESVVGKIDGIVEFIAYIIRIFSGSLSDLLQNRKAILVVGYSISALIKPLFSVANSVFFVFVVRSFDRVSNGLQASPRDALIGDLSPHHRRGACYGLSRSLKTAGSVLGSLFVYWIMIASNNNFRLLFSIAIIPSVLALVLLIFRVKEPSQPISPKPRVKRKFEWRSFSQLNSSYWRVILITTLFQMGHFGETYLVFKVKEVGMKIEYISFVMLIFNLGQFFISYPLGWASDKFSRRFILCIGFTMMLIANVFMSYGTSVSTILVGVLMWGLQFGATQSVLTSMVTDSTDRSIRGTAFGIFYTVMGICILVASWWAGEVWEHYGSSKAFSISGIISLVSIVLLFMIVKPGKKHGSHN